MPGLARGENLLGERVYVLPRPVQGSRILAHVYDSSLAKNVRLFKLSKEHRTKHTKFLTTNTPHHPRLRALVQTSRVRRACMGTVFSEPARHMKPQSPAPVQNQTATRHICFEALRIRPVCGCILRAWRKGEGNLDTSRCKWRAVRMYDTMVFISVSHPVCTGTDRRREAVESLPTLSDNDTRFDSGRQPALALS